MYNGKEFKSVESAYHASKYLDKPEIFDQFVPLNAVDAYKLSKTTGAYDYAAHNKIKLDVMRELVDKKYAQEPFKSRLKQTGNAILQEWNWWGNKYWGMSPDGENWLGRIIMETRAKL